MLSISWKNFYRCFTSFKLFPANQHLHQNHHPIKSGVDNPLRDLSTSKSPTSSTAAAAADDDFLTPSDEFSDMDTDFSTIMASERFFCSSPGHSNSIVPPLVTDCVAVQTDSPDPFADFRQSMQEMVEAHRLKDVEEEWDYLRELLLCYLNLNPKNTHKFIVGAFLDLVVSLASSSTTETAAQSRRKIDQTSLPRD